MDMFFGFCFGSKFESAYGSNIRTISFVNNFDLNRRDYPNCFYSAFLEALNGRWYPGKPVSN